MELTERLFVRVIALAFGLSAVGVVVYLVQQVHLHLHHILVAIPIR